MGERYGLKHKMALALLMGVGCVGLLCSVSDTAVMNLAAFAPSMQRSVMNARSCGGLRGVACASQVSGNAVKEAQLKKMTEDAGFISALDESGGTSPKTLATYGVTDKDYKDDAEMMSMVHDLRAKIMTNSEYKEGSIIGAILFEDTINRDVEGIPTTQYLWDKKKVVPFLKSDVGLAPPADGVQMMKDHPGLEAMLDRGLAKGVWGTKQRSQIQSANPEGIKKLVAQQFEFGKRTIAKGMIPILEPEVDI